MNLPKQHHEIVAYLKRELKDANRELKDWKLKLEDNPLHAFTWSRDAFHASAVIAVLGRLLTEMEKPLKDGHTFDPYYFREEQARLVVSMAQGSTNTSSSMTSNVAEAYVLVVNAQFLQFLDGQRG